MIRLNVRAPIVLAHGLFGFERIGFGPWTLATYFRGIPEYLRSLGVRVFVPRVHPTAGIERRSRRLGEHIEARFPGEPIHIIAHSFGGLDARQLLCDDRWSSRVLSLTTIATPHLGSSLAATATRGLGPVYRLLRALDWDHQGFFDLLPDKTRRWHEANPAPPGVACFRIVGNPPPDEVCWPLRRLHTALSKWEGLNDGLVSVESSRAFGIPLPDCPVDHLRQMNWCVGMPRGYVWRKVRAMYRLILRAIEPFDRVENGEAAWPGNTAEDHVRQTATLQPPSLAAGFPAV